MTFWGLTFGLIWYSWWKKYLVNQRSSSSSSSSRLVVGVVASVHIVLLLVCVKMFAPPVLAEDSPSCRPAGTDNMDPADGFSLASKSTGLSLSVLSYVSC